MKLKVCIFWVSMKLSQYFISIKVSHKWHLIFAIFPYAGKLLQIPLCYFLPIGALGSDFWVTRRRELIRKHRTKVIACHDPSHKTAFSLLGYAWKIVDFAAAEGNLCALLELEWRNSHSTSLSKSWLCSLQTWSPLSPTTFIALFCHCSVRRRPSVSVRSAWSSFLERKGTGQTDGGSSTARRN